MLFYAAFVLLIALGYIVIIFLLVRGWNQIGTWSCPAYFTADQRVSVLVAARNEAGGIANCVRSLLSQSYPSALTEILVLDNHSSDDTLAILRQFEDARLQVIALADYVPEQGTYKKEALTFGIQRATGSWIFTTDGDCQVSPDWLRETMSFVQSRELDMAVGAVKLVHDGSLVQSYQSLDMAGLTAASAGGLVTGLLHSCNGANLAFRKSAFADVGGHEEHRHHASGDDLFLLQKMMARDPGKVVFLKSATTPVLSASQSDWSSLWRQRHRWAAKSRGLPHVPTRLVNGWVFAQSLVLVINTILGFAVGGAFVFLAIVQWATKIFADFALLSRANRFYRTGVKGWHWVLALLIHPLYVTTVGLTALTSPKVIWKGRLVRS